MGRLSEQALELLSTQPDIQLLVTDHAMPQMTGARDAQQARDNARAGSMPPLGTPVIEARVEKARIEFDPAKDAATQAKHGVLWPWPPSSIRTASPSGSAISSPCRISVRSVARVTGYFGMGKRRQ